MNNDMLMMKMPLPRFYGNFELSLNELGFVHCILVGWICCLETLKLCAYLYPCCPTLLNRC